MTSLRKRHVVGLVALAVAGAGLSVPALRVLQHAHAADDVVEGFFPALCAGEMPPAELLALADWPLDPEGIGCRPHAGVLDAVTSIAGAGGRPGAISRDLAEYVLSLDPAPRGAPWNHAPQPAADPSGAGSLGQAVSSDGAAGVSVSAVQGSYVEHAGPIGALGFEDDETSLGIPSEGPPPDPFAVRAAAAGTDLPLFAGQLIEDTTLEELRGGYAVPGGLELSFGIERVVYINGELASTTTLNIADLSQYIGGAVAAAGLPVGASLAVIQNGPNNTFDASALASGAFATVIQNTLNDQKIQTITTINAQANSLQMLQASRFGESLRNAVNASLLR